MSIWITYAQTDHDIQQNSFCTHNQRHSKGCESFYGDGIARL